MSYPNTLGMYLAVFPHSTRDFGVPSVTCNIIVIAFYLSINRISPNTYRDNPKYCKVKKRNSHKRFT